MWKQREESDTGEWGGRLLRLVASNLCRGKLELLGDRQDGWDAMYCWGGNKGKSQLAVAALWV